MFEGGVERCCHEVRFETRRCVKMHHWGSSQRLPVRSSRPLCWTLGGGDWWRGM